MISIIRIKFVLVSIVMNMVNLIGQSMNKYSSFLIFKRWNYTSLNNGLGGSEEAVLYLAEALAIQYPQYDIYSPIFLFSYSY